MNRKNKLKYLPVLILFLLSTSLFAQSIELKNVTKRGFKGIKNLDKQGYYAQFVEGNTGTGKNVKTILHFYILGNDLVKTSDFTLELNFAEKIEDVAYSGGNFMVITSDQESKTRTLKIIDKQGKEIKSKVTKDVPYRLLAKPSIALPIGEGDFIVINYIKEKKIGYSIERYTNLLDQKFSQSQIPDKKKLYPVDYTISGNQLYVLEYVDADMSDFFEYYLASFDISTGALLHKEHLKSADSKAYGFATFIKPGKEGSVVTGGMYFNSSKTQESNSDGFFAARMGADGKLTFTYVDWKKAQETLDDKSTVALWGGKTKTLMHDLTVKDDGSFTLIGENFRRGDADLAGEKSKSGFGLATAALKASGNGDGSNETAVTVSEFALMDFDEKGNFKSIRKINKPSCVTIVSPTTDESDKTYIGQMKGLNLANILNNNGYFPYRFVVQESSKQYITSWHRYDPIYKELLYFTPIDGKESDTVSIEVTRSEMKVLQDRQTNNSKGGLGKLAKKMGDISRSNFENSFELRGSHDPNDYRSKGLFSRVIAANIEGKIVIYDFIPTPDPEGKEKKGWLSLAPDSKVGNLKIWYVDVPKR